MSELKNRFDFVFIFDVQDGNPNGDPDAGNLPRVDAETGMGLVTDVCIKRKVRNYVQMTQNPEEGYDVLIRSKEISGFNTFINGEIRKCFESLKLNLESAKDSEGKKREKKGRAQGKEEASGRAFMCKTYYDVRTFGAVMSTGANAGQVRGPIQLTFARSVEPIVSSEFAITVCAAREEDKPYDRQVGIQGRKATVPYGLYVCHGFVSANLARQTGFSTEDLDLFWEALKNMFDCDRSAARGLMSARKLIVFRHDSMLGNAPANVLFDRVAVARKSEGVARSFSDYEVTVDVTSLPDGVHIEELI